MPILRRGGRPGLLGMVARTAVVAGTATAVSGAVTQRQQNRAAERYAAEQYTQQQTVVPEAAPPPAIAPTPRAAASAPTVDVVTRLQQLGDLHTQGLLSAEEFALAKQQLLGS